MLRPSSLRPALRPRALRQPNAVTRRTLFSSKKSEHYNELDLGRINNKRSEWEQNRRAFLAAGAFAGIVSFCYTAYKLKQSIAKDREIASRGVKCDTPANIPTETFKTEAGEKRKIVVLDDEGNEIVPTGNGVVPALPRRLFVDMPSSTQEQPNPILAAAISADQGTEFTLVGLGTRTVTFLGFEVYVMGFYVATQDIARLQKHLVKKINQNATTLIPSEKDELRKALRDATEGEETWNELLADAKIRSVVRITPVRDTDFHHLRDAFVRAITTRTQRKPADYTDEGFGVAMRDLKALFNRGSLKKRAELLLCRDDRGVLSALFSDGKDLKAERENLGSVADERLSRLLWLNWLAGSKVASEPARQNIIEGVMEFVERPVGTVATQVV